MVDVPRAPCGPAIIDIDGISITEEDRALLKHPATAGIILFSRNIASTDQLADLCLELKEIRSDLLISIDQEGGRVQRIKQGVTRLPPMAWLGRVWTEDQDLGLAMARDLGWLMAVELRELGVDLSFAPVLDLDSQYCPAIGDRAFSDSADVVIALSRQFVAGMAAAGMSAVGKHFPGHGRVSLDSHFDLPVDPRTLDELQGDDMLPFATLIKEGLDGIMAAHIHFEAVDAKPACFSHLWLTRILREQLGFAGLIFSDDLSMKATEVIGDYNSRTLAALDAGCDLVLLCNNRSAVKQVLPVLEKRLLSNSTYQRKLDLVAGSPLTLSRDQSERKQAVVSQLATLQQRFPF